MEEEFEIDKYNKSEFWLVTGVFIFFTLGLINDAAKGVGFRQEQVVGFATLGVSLSYIENYFLPWLFRYIALYGVYVLAHFVILKNLVNRVAIPTNIIYALLLFAALIGVWTWSSVWINYYLFLKPVKDRTVLYGSVGLQLFWRSVITVTWVTGIYVVYSYLKYKKNILFTFDGLRLTPLRRDTYILFAIWALLYAFINEPAVLALPVIPIYIYLSARLIPLVKSQNKGFINYLTRVTLIAFVIGLVVVFIYGLMGNFKVETFTLIALLYASSQVFIVAPATWAIYHHRLSRNAELTGLKTALGQSSANLDFLRSQINPHFLFNALNTLYGTAIQENADRTGEGIQKLGDMMRFMLHENTQEKIPLMREVDYLKNYIDLQKLRTHTSPDIVIQTEIEESVNGLQIAPMLLIPFVENAFKHGISLREASHIKITLHTEGAKLFFDVHNSVHPKTGIDPEKNHTGIGLENVKQRLQLLYPDRHELMIRETTKEFFVHLTVQL
ncbi:sensor histidine kinase [Mucilaginibacter sp. HD30]